MMKQATRDPHTQKKTHTHGIHFITTLDRKRRLIEMHKHASTASRIYAGNDDRRKYAKFSGRPGQQEHCALGYGPSGHGETEISVVVFNRHVSSADIDEAFRLLHGLRMSFQRNRSLAQLWASPHERSRSRYFGLNPAPLHKLRLLDPGILFLLGIVFAVAVCLWLSRRLIRFRKQDIRIESSKEPPGDIERHIASELEAEILRRTTLRRAEQR
jgi:hypothetical protein